jgi:CHAT domain-containing protein
VLAQISLRTGNADAASRECEAALARLAGLEFPALAFQGNFLMGQIAESAGRRDVAYTSYQAAREALESLRSSLRGEELKIAFMKNKLEVYEALVDICLRRDAGDSGEEAFRYMEQAKSRSLMDLLFSGSRAFAAEDPGQSALVRQVRNLREELNWYYHRIEQEHLRTEEKSPQRIQHLQEEARIRENEFLRALQECPPTEPESAAIRPAAPASVESVQAALLPGTALLEYFSVRDRFFAAFITRENLRIVPLTPVSRVRELLRLLQFQLSKFRLGGDYVATFQQSLLEATNAHLSELYEELLAPILHGWRGEHLIVVPHGVLHYLPFHALFDGGKYVIDALRVSYAPSATIYTHCHQKAANVQGPCLILGVPDANAPHILDEVQAVASSVSTTELFVGDRATLELLKEKGAHSRIIHIAAHGNFREDNPMFSNIRLGGSFLSLYDLYNLRLPAELVTLSGCATGLNAVATGDELLGLVRGLLFAGAQTLLLTLWEVHDKSAAQFMKAFYGMLQTTGNKAESLQRAMLQLRESHPHPYFWAPFLLVGKVFPTV